jgi:hypothetical protein
MSQCEHAVIGQSSRCPNMTKQITTRCRNSDDAIFDVPTMTQQPASPPDVYSIAVMTKSSSKVLTRQISHE